MSRAEGVGFRLEFCNSGWVRKKTRMMHLPERQKEWRHNNNNNNKVKEEPKQRHQQPRGVHGAKMLYRQFTLTPQTADQPGSQLRIAG